MGMFGLFEIVMAFVEPQNASRLLAAAGIQVICMVVTGGSAYTIRQATR
jgi:hypothetical protein